MRIGVMGGSFNPIHYGHLVAAAEAQEEFYLDKVLFIPAAIPPHKGSEELIEPFHRLAMVILATLSNEKFIPCPIEIERGGKSYSVDTIIQLQQMYGPGAEFFFILGVDSFIDISYWKDAEKLLHLCNFIVTTRPGYDVDLVPEALEYSIKPRHRGLNFELFEDGLPQRHPAIAISGSPFLVYLMKINSFEISSTDIRKRVSRGQSICYLLPDSVENYIRKNKLYQRTD